MSLSFHKIFRGLSFRSQVALPTDPEAGDVAFQAGKLQVYQNSQWDVIGGSNGALLTDGSASAPAISFISDTNTGLYRKSSDVIGAAASGVEVMTIAPTSITAAVGMLLVDGSASAPAVRFSSDTNTGLYRKSSDIIGVSASGVEIMTVASTGVTVNGSITVANGSTGKLIGIYYSAGTSGGNSVVQGSVAVPTGAKMATISVVGDYYNNIDNTHNGYYEARFSVDAGNRIFIIANVAHTGTQGFNCTYSAGTLSVQNNTGMTYNQSGNVLIRFYG
jgi:hypothetical protein